MTNAFSIDNLKAAVQPGAKILFANVPADGHFNPLTGLAVHLKAEGYDVLWYTSERYAPKIKKLGIPHYPFVTALDVDVEKGDELFPNREKQKTQVAKLNFDLINIFILRGPEYYTDIRAIHQSFPFDLLVADLTFAALPMVKEHMKIPAIAVGIVPIAETSKDLPPMGLGMLPAKTALGKMKHAAMRFIADHVLFKRANAVLKTVLAQYDIQPEGNMFDTIIRKATLVLQSGTPGFEYKRSDLGKNIRFVGPLLPHQTSKKEKWFDPRLMAYEKIILVTQGTVERDVEKIIVPTLQAYQNTDRLVIVTTGGSGTQALRERFTAPNVIIEDFIPFTDVMPYANVYVTNGGYGGVLLSIQNNLPLVVGGIHEGKLEINARVEYFKLGVNLRTEKPTPDAVKRGVEEVLGKNLYKENVKTLNKEFNQYNPQQLSTHYIEQVLVTSTQHKATAPVRALVV